MLSWIKKVTTPPSFEGNEDKGRVAVLLNLLFWTTLSLAVLSGLVTVVINIVTAEVIVNDLLYPALFIFLALGGLFLIHKGQVRLVGILFICLLGMVFVPIVIEAGGVTRPLFSVYLLLLVIAAVLLWRTAVLWVAGWGVVVGLGLTIVQLTSDFIESPPVSPVSDWVTYSLIMAFSAILLYRNNLSATEAFEKQRGTVQELQAVRTSLEQHAADRARGLAQRTHYLEAISLVAQDVASVLDVQELLTRVAGLISEQFGFYHVGIFLLDDSGEWAVLRATSSEGGQRMLARGYRLGVGQAGTVGYVTAQGEPRVVLDAGMDAMFFDNPDLPETRSVMTLPLRARGRIIGALDVQSKQPAAFAPEDTAVLQGMADQVALAISNAQLFERLQESIAAERMAYGELSRRAWSEMLQARRDVGYVDAEEGTYPVGGQMHPVMRQAGKSGTVVEDGNTIALPVRLREGDNVLGVVRLRKPEGTGSWTEEQIAMMRSIAEQTGVALERARLYQDSRRLAMRERLISEATSRMRQSLDVEAVLKTAADEIYQALNLDEVVVRLLEDQEVQASADDSEEISDFDGSKLI